MFRLATQQQFVLTHGLLRVRRDARLGRPTSPPVRMCLAYAATILMMAISSGTHAVVVLPHTYHVGPTGAGSSCDFSDIQTAIGATAASGDTIVIDGGLGYSGQHLTIANESLTISAGPCSLVIGGAAAAPTSDRVTISGNAGASAPVISITGATTSVVTLNDLQITGNTSSSDGGGIRYTGNGTLILNNVLVNGNEATDGGGIEVISQGVNTFLAVKTGSALLNNTAHGRGGGIYFSGNGGELLLAAATVKANHALMIGGGVSFRGAGSVVLDSDTQILSNTAAIDGGGIDIAGAVYFAAEEPRISIEGNSAGVDGGGIFLLGGVNAYISSPDSDGVGMITGNHADNGGGIYATPAADSNTSLQIHLYTSDPSQPVSITDNTATTNGGGIYLQPDSFSGADISLCASDFRLQHNGAQEGAAIYGAVDVYSGSGVYFNRGCPGGDFPPTCNNSTLCNTVNNNYVDDPTQGSAIYLADDATFVGSRFSMLNNNAAHMVRSGNDYDSVSLSNCLIAHNTSHQLVYVSGLHSSLGITSCTFANDLIGGADQYGFTYMIHADTGLTLSSDILDEPGALAVEYPDGSTYSSAISFVLSTNTGTMPLGFAIVMGEPVFADAANDDYHLQLNSPGIDFAPKTAGIDLDGNPRGVDMPTIADAYGIQDLGAYERHFACGGGDSIFCDGFNL